MMINGYTAEETMIIVPIQVVYACLVVVVIIVMVGPVDVL